MLEYIIILPLELQNKILDEIPEFTRLSKNTVSGIKHLKSLHSKTITKKDINTYISKFKPDRYFCYYIDKNKNIFVILENYWEFGYYRTIYHNFNYGDEITINIRNNLTPYYIINENNMCYDIKTTYNIYKYLRKEYINLNETVLNVFNNTLEKYRTDNEFTSKIIQTNYLYSNLLNINDHKRLSVLTARLSNMLQSVDKERILSYLQNFEDDIIDIYKYIEEFK